MGMYCACIYYACGDNSVERNHMEIAKYANIDYKIVRECVNIFNRFNL